MTATDGAPQAGLVVVRAEPGQAWVARPSEPVEAAPSLSRARTGADGRFELRVAGDVAHELWVWPTRGRLPVIVRGLRPAPGERVEVDVVMPDRGALVGAVVDERGRGVDGVRLALARDDGPWAFAGTTEDDGSFGIAGVDEGVTWVRVLRGSAAELPAPGAMAEGARWRTFSGAGEGYVVHHAAELARVEVVPGAAASVRLVVVAEDGRVAGVVRDPDGRPVVDAVVVLQREPGGAPALLGHRQLMTDTGTDGRFELTRLAAARCSIAVDYVDVGATPRPDDDRVYAGALEHVEVGDDVEIRLQVREPVTP